MTRGPYICKKQNGQIQLIACNADNTRGAIALITPWYWYRMHVAVKTDGLQHPGCIDFRLTNNRSYSAADFDDSKLSRAYHIMGGAGIFQVQLRWATGHSPYPEIQNMEVWCFGVYLGNRSYPKAPGQYINVANVFITYDGVVMVNGVNTGVWPEFIQDYQ